MILSIYFTFPPPSDVIIRLFCVFRNICFMFFVIFVLVISSFLFCVFRLWLWLITVCPYRSSQPTLVEFDRFSRSRTTRSCVFAANILHGESLVVGTSNAWWHGSVGRTNCTKDPTIFISCVNGMMDHFITTRMISRIHSFEYWSPATVGCSWIR